MLVLMVLTGIIGSFIVAAIAQNRPWLHMGMFLLVMIAIDLQAVFGHLSPQPLWFKASIMLTLLLQAWLGGLMARTMFKQELCLNEHMGQWPNSSFMRMPIFVSRLTCKLPAQRCASARAGLTQGLRHP